MRELRIGSDVDPLDGSDGHQLFGAALVLCACLVGAALVVLAAAAWWAL